MARALHMGASSTSSHDLFAGHVHTLGLSPIEMLYSKVYAARLQSLAHCSCKLKSQLGEQL